MFTDHPDLYQNRRQLTFRCHNSELVSLLLSKDELKIRIQANRLSLIWPFLMETNRRVQLPSTGSYKTSFKEKLPLRELDQTIDNHFQCRQSLKQLRKVLEDQTL